MWLLTHNGLNIMSILVNDQNLSAESFDNLILMKACQQPHLMKCTMVTPIYTSKVWTANMLTQRNCTVV